MNNFEQDLSALINRYAKENDSNTPDFILAKYLISCLHSYNVAVLENARWHGVQESDFKWPTKVA